MPSSRVLGVPDGERRLCLDRHGEHLPPVDAAIEQLLPIGVALGIPEMA